jgi:hypothetical protein
VIRLEHTPAPASPRQALADLLGGVLVGRDAITVGGNAVWVSVAGVVRVNGRVLGVWSDGPEVLAAEYHADIADPERRFARVIVDERSAS